MWAKNQFSSMHDICFEFVYRRIKTNPHDKNPYIDDLWRSRNILVGSCSYDGNLYLKVAVYLIDYDIQFFIHCKNNKTDQFMTPSVLQTVNIPSFLLNNNYQINDIVSFRNDHTFYTTEGKIVEILDDNKFKISFFQFNINFDPSKDEMEENENENERDPLPKVKWIESSEIVDISRIYHKGSNIQYEIDLIDPDSMFTNLLIKRNDIGSKRIFNALVHFYNRESFIYCYEHYGNEKLLYHFEAMSIFVSKNVFDFLFEPEFHYKVDCLLNGDHHHMLKFKNLRQADIRTKFELQQQRIGKVEVDVDEFNELSYQCDCCRTGIRDWNFVYQCSVSPLDRHDVCLNCVNTVIQLNKELRRYLDEILNDDLNDDVIQVLVSFVIGNVILHH